MATYDSVFGGVNPLFVDPNAEEGYYLLFWNCEECGTEVIPAIASLSTSGGYCPNPTCFHRHDNHEFDFGIDSVSDTRITDQKVLDAIAAGKITNRFKIIDPELIHKIDSSQADWRCKYCGAVHADEGLAKELLHCDNCDQYQLTPEDSSAPQRSKSGQAVNYVEGELVDGDRFTGNVTIPESMVDSMQSLGQNTNRYRRDAVGTYRDTSNSGSFGADSSMNATNEQLNSPIRLPSVNIPWRGIGIGALIAGGISAAVGAGIWFFAPHQVDFSVTDLPWEVTVEVQEYKPVQESGWDQNAPAGARILSSETRQSGTHLEQRGMKTEHYQETYTITPARTVPDGETCTTTNTGKGAGSRSCVPKTKTIPAVTGTRPATRQVPNMVSIPDYDTWQTWIVNKWVYETSYNSTGEDDQPRVAPHVTLDNHPYQQRTLTPEVTCRISGIYSWENEQKVGTFTIPCNQFDLLDEGDQIQLSITRAGTSELLLPSAQ